MMLMITGILVVLGLCLGSFLNAMVWRMHAGKDWVKDRSRCEHCNHILAAKDLVPVFSWLALRGRCRYCRRPVAWQHPAVELATAATFALSYVFWPANLGGPGQLTLFITWLAVAVGLLALLVYDARWMILPNPILYSTLAVALAGRLVYIFAYAPDKAHSLWLLTLSLLVASGVFWLLFMVSRGRWIGYGDVRLGLVTGTVLASPALSFLMIFLASILGTLVALPALITGSKTMTSKLPYGPFLIIATGIALLFGQSIIDWYKHIFLP